MRRRIARPWLAAAAALGWSAAGGPSQAQVLPASHSRPAHVMAPGGVPLPPTGPAVAPCGHPHGCKACVGGPIRRAMHHVAFTLKDRFIGYPDQFVEPPLGFTINEHFATMKAKADPHEFFLYQTDFVRESTTLSPTGAQRLTLIANRLNCWLGPVVVEWTPENPQLAESRRMAVLQAMASAGIPLDPDRVLVGPSPYPGLIGDIAERYYPIVVDRSARAPMLYSLPPQPPATSTTGVSGAGGGASIGGGGLP